MERTVKLADRVRKNHSRGSQRLCNGECYGAVFEFLFFSSQNLSMLRVSPTSLRSNHEPREKKSAGGQSRKCTVRHQKKQERASVSTGHRLRYYKKDVELITGNKSLQVQVTWRRSAGKKYLAHEEERMISCGPDLFPFRNVKSNRCPKQTMVSAMS